MNHWALVGIATSGRRKIPVADLAHEHVVKVLGPFDTADDARQVANDVAMGDGVLWTVVPLRSADSVIR